MSLKPTTIPPNGTESGYVFFHSANTGISRPFSATLRQIRNHREREYHPLKLTDGTATLANRDLMKLALNAAQGGLLSCVRALTDYGKFMDTVTQAPRKAAELRGHIAPSGMVASIGGSWGLAPFTFPRISSRRAFRGSAGLLFLRSAFCVPSGMEHLKASTSLATVEKIGPSSGGISSPTHSHSRVLKH